MRKMTVTYKGTVVPLAPMGTWTYDEAEVAERATGISVGQIAYRQFNGADSKAALGFAAVSLFRAGVEFDPSMLGRETLDDLFVDFLGTPAGGDATEEEESPPAPAADVAAASDETAAAAAAKDAD